MVSTMTTKQENFCIEVEEHSDGVTVSSPGRISTTWSKAFVAEEHHFQKMEDALQAILIEATRVNRGNFVSLVDDLEKIRALAYKALKDEK